MLKRHNSILQYHSRELYTKVQMHTSAFSQGKMESATREELKSNGFLMQTSSWLLVKDKIMKEASSIFKLASINPLLHQHLIDG